MPLPCPLHDRHQRPLPRARVDRIDTFDVALDVLAHAADCPLVPQTIVVGLDDRHRGRSIHVIAGTLHPDALLDVLDHLLVARRRRSPRNDGEAVLAATVRPGGDVLRSDVDRWLEASRLTDEVGVELLEWFVVGRRLVCPRDLLGERPRWPRPLAS